MLQKTPMNTHAFGPKSGVSSSGMVTQLVAGHVVCVLLANCRFVIVHGYL
jgi:hypothetical protein